MLLYTFLFGYSQVSGDTIYLDLDQNQTTKEKAACFRIISIDTSKILFQVKDYYLSGQIRMQGAYRSINPDRKIGEFTYWYENGEKYIRCNYKDGELNDRYCEWYENGVLKTEKSYQDGKLDGFVKVWTNEGIIKRNVHYKKGYKHGQFITYYSNGQPVRRDVYRYDSLVRGKCFNSQGKDTAYFDYFKMPLFKGGLEGFKHFILENLNYPDTARFNEEEGSVQIRFTVGKDGFIKRISLIKADKEYFNEEVIQAVASSPQWIPGKRDGKLVDVTITLPIKFRLK